MVWINTLLPHTERLVRISPSRSRLGTPRFDILVDGIHSTWQATMEQFDTNKQSFLHASSRKIWTFTHIPGPVGNTATLLAEGLDFSACISALVV